MGHGLRLAELSEAGGIFEFNTLCMNAISKWFGDYFESFDSRGFIMRTQNFISSMVGVVAAVAGSANAGTVSFATAPAGGTYSTIGTVAGNSSAWNSTGWDASTGAWQLTAAPAFDSFATFNVSSPTSIAVPSTSLGNAYASGTARYAANSNVPSAGQNISPVFAFYVSIGDAYDSTITIGGIGGTYGLDPSNPSDWGTPLRNRQAFGFQLGANAGGAIVQVKGNRSGLAEGFAVVGGTTTWDQLMAATTAGGSTWGSLSLGAMSVICAYAPGSYDPATAGNSTSVLIQKFTVVPAPGAAALIGLAGIVAGRRRRN